MAGWKLLTLCHNRVNGHSLHALSACRLTLSVVDRSRSSFTHLLGIVSVKKANLSARAHTVLLEVNHVCRLLDVLVCHVKLSLWIINDILLTSPQVL